MKILMVNKFLYPNGGAETYMFRLGEYLTAQGNEVQYFGMEHENRCVSNNARQYTNTVDFRNASAIEKIKASVKTIYSKEAYEKIGIVLDDFKPDIVHMNNINFQLTPSIIYAVKKRNIPIIQTVHDCQIACPNHRMYIEHRETLCDKCVGGAYTNCVKEKCVHSSLLKSVIACIESQYYHKKNTYNLVDKYICPSHYMAETIEKGGVEGSRIAVMHNFSDARLDKPQRNNGKKYVLYFGRLSVEKGIKTLISVCAELENINFVFAGEGPLEEQCRKVKNIECVGFKSGDELKELIMNASFSVVPSEWYENCPMSVVESKALGTPVIGSNLGGTPELIEDGETGFIFEAGNRQQLLEKTVSLYYNTELTDKMSVSCLKSSTNTIDAYTSGLMQIYEQILTEHKNG